MSIRAISNARSLATAAIVAVLLSSAAVACSSDDGESSQEPQDGAQATETDEGGGDEDGDDEGSEMSADDRERVARALVGTVGADEYEIDGDTLVYKYSDGSRDDPGVEAHCMSMIAVQGAFELVILEFPDGTHECGLASLGDS